NEKFYRIGSSFGNDSVWCVNAFRDATQRKTDQANELRCLAATAPQLPPLCSNEDIINVLDDYNYKRHPNVLASLECAAGRKGLLEPPMPGWTGFVPRSKVTEHGHGVRYHVMAENCYKDFKDCLDRVSHEHPAKEPVYVSIKIFEGSMLLLTDSSQALQAICGPLSAPSVPSHMPLLGPWLLGWRACRERHPVHSLSLCNQADF
uniref:Chromosome 10 open reading frame 82 n=1 Tax=Varanus komodoensis TaxID=61221 RepID=A0A8D2JCY3_VARKO